MQPDLDIGARSPAVSLTAVCIIAATALAVAMGIGRFALTPLLPLMLRDAAVAQSAGAWLAASNYLGYLAGALIAGRLGLAPYVLMRASLAGIVASTAAMGLLDGLAAWIVLRFAAGVLSAWALVAISAWSLQHLARARRADLSGVAFAGVGLGIAFTGLFCLAGARPGVSAGQLWLALGVLAALAVIPLGLYPGREAAAPTGQLNPDCPPDLAPRSDAGLVIAYGILGFGYVLPATFLPALARELVDDPRVFGLAWPIFGVAAALSTVATARYATNANRVRIWAISHMVMAAGVILPSLWLDPAAIGVAALAVGSTFMVATMLGLQEARARAPRSPTVLLGAMTAAFAVGQLAGPLVSGGIDMLQVGHRAALSYALWLAAVSLAASAIYLWHQSR